MLLLRVIRVFCVGTRFPLTFIPKDQLLAACTACFTNVIAYTTYTRSVYQRSHTHTHTHTHTHLTLSTHTQEEREREQTNILFC